MFGYRGKCRSLEGEWGARGRVFEAWWAPLDDACDEKACSE